MNNDTEVSIKFKNTITGEKKLQQYAETLQKIQSVLSSINDGKIKQMEQSGQQMKNVSNEASKMAKLFFILFFILFFVSLMLYFFHTPFPLLFRKTIVFWTVKSSQKICIKRQNFIDLDNFLC